MRYELFCTTIKRTERRKGTKQGENNCWWKQFLKRFFWESNFSRILNSKCNTAQYILMCAVWISESGILCNKLWIFGEAQTGKMSANSLDRVSSSSKQPNADDHSSSDEQPKEKKVCFVCGSRTIFIVNIRERRCGPNMIDVISEKFKMRPLSDDKFLCYSCNNWLINWYSMQKKEDTSSQDDDLQQTTSSTVIAAAEPAKTSGKDNWSE